MDNVLYEVEDGVLVIRVNLNERHGPSTSGKSTFVGNTGGFVPLVGEEFPKGMKFSLNVIVPVEA